MSLNIKDGKVTVKILKDERGIYKTALSTKEIDQNGNEIKVPPMYINVGFKKGTELKNKSIIEINNGFLTFFRMKTEEIDEDGELIYRKYPKLVVLDFKLIEEGIDEVCSYRRNEKTENHNTFNYSDFNIGTDDLPF